MLKARDIMTKDVITVRADATIEELARLLVKHNISGVPVVDDEGRLKDGAAQLEARARENVIFEAGMACALYRRDKRLCFFVVGNTNIPSDIKGLLWEQFDPGNPDVGRLEAVLQNWGFRWKVSAPA